ncbi:MAG: hypothetical protein BAJALOKI1v1_1730001 [Promethearchaeota archaeon]|nr:MAG: hypothetical protein BAJALOKI1v1_1730001 [Candidatus Lokiarchaeota archaeon]
MVEGVYLLSELHYSLLILLELAIFDAWICGVGFEWLENRWYFAIPLVKVDIIRLSGNGFKVRLRFTMAILFIFPHYWGS